MTTLTPIGPGALPSSVPAAKTQLAGAAKQFEAMLMRRMLAEARKADFGDDGLFSSQAMGTFREMQDDRIADVVADTGTLGLAKLIEAQIARQTGANPAPGA